jgi:hypothetical protein
MQPTLTIPAAPLVTTASSSANVHQLKTVSPLTLILEPRPAHWIWAGISLATSIVALVICFQKQATPAISLAVAAGPLAAAIGFIIAGLTYKRFGTRATFDRAAGEVLITGQRHGSGHRFHLQDVSGIQFCAAGLKGDEGSWHAYQVNLLRGIEAVERINLLDSGDEETLRTIAKQIAEFLNIPLYIGDQRIR